MQGLAAGWKAGKAAYMKSRGKKGSGGRVKFLPGVTYHGGAGMSFRGGGMGFSGSGLNFHGAGLRGKRLLPRRGSGRRTI